MTVYFDQHKTPQADLLGMSDGTPNTMPCVLFIRADTVAHSIRCKTHDYEITQFAFMEIHCLLESGERCVLDTRERTWAYRDGEWTRCSLCGWVIWPGDEEQCPHQRREGYTSRQAD